MNQRGKFITGSSTESVGVTCENNLCGGGHVLIDDSYTTTIYKNSYYPFFKRCPTLGFCSVSWTQTRNNNLRITQRVAQCGNRTYYTLHGSPLPSHGTNRAVKKL
ncbi:hypothetical protein SFRURICE_011496, partial [Spodoptera frugiperda]